MSIIYRVENIKGEGYLKENTCLNNVICYNKYTNNNEKENVMFKIQIHVTGIKRKQRTVKEHTFLLGHINALTLDLSDLEDKARTNLEVNMQSVLNANMKVFRVTEDGMTKSPAEFTKRIM